jgi:tRNA (guanine-N7-)-methyltransferase
MNWEELYPELHAEAAEKGISPPQVHFVDIGCGFGGLTVRLAETYPEKLVCGMEIRQKVSGELAPVKIAI